MSIEINANAFDMEYRKVVTVETLAEMLLEIDEGEILFFNGDLVIDEDDCNYTIWYGIQKTTLFDEDNLIAIGCLGGGYTETYETPIIDTDEEWLEATIDFIRDYINNSMDFDNNNEVVICTYYLDK